MHLCCPKKDSKKKIQPQCLLRRERQIKEIQLPVVCFVGNIIRGECWKIESVCYHYGISSKISKTVSGPTTQESKDPGVNKEKKIVWLNKISHSGCKIMVMIKTMDVQTYVTFGS